MKSRNALITIAAVAGVGLGSFGLASALGGDEPAPPAVETEEPETPGDEADDGIDHQFEGEKVGENGDGIPGPDEAAEEANEADDNESENESEGDALTGTELEQASAAALAHTGQGTVADAEAEDGYEVEVVLDDGSEATVLLDADFNVTGEEADAPEGAEDDDGTLVGQLEQTGSMTRWATPDRRPPLVARSGVVRVQQPFSFDLRASNADPARCC